MTKGMRQQIVVSTLAEAEFYAEHGFDDITYAYPMSHDKVSRCASFVSKLQVFHVAVDNAVIVEILGKYELPPNKKWSILLMVDCGYGRGKQVVHFVDHFNRTLNPFEP